MSFYIAHRSKKGL